ncbi:hypothetical protein ACTXT7_016899 [Hymenolepis weldensis]
MSSWPYESKPSSVTSKRVYRFLLPSIIVPFHSKYAALLPHARTCPIDSPTTNHNTHHASHTTHALVIHRLLRFPLIALLPHLSLSRLNPHRDLISTFWPSRLLVFCPKTVVVVAHTNFPTGLHTLRQYWSACSRTASNISVSTVLVAHNSNKNALNMENAQMVVSV